MCRVALAIAFLVTSFASADSPVADFLKRPLVSPDEITLASLPVELRTRMLSSRGGARIEVTPRANLSDSGALERFVAAVETIAPDATGPAVVMVEWGRLASRATLQALALAALGITGMLWFQWRRISDVALAIVPLALAALYTAAAMALLGMQVNLVNVIVVPMLLGIGIDSGVHLVESARARAGEAEALDAATARAVVFSALTTLASFVSLGYAHHRGMAALGQLLSLGLVATLMCYVVVFPALRALLRARDRSTAAQVSVSSSAPR